MTTREVFNLPRRCDVEAVGELLDLRTDTEREFFRMRFIEDLSLDEIADYFCKSYSYVAHLSARVNSLLSLIDL